MIWTSPRANYLNPLFHFDPGMNLPFPFPSWGRPWHGCREQTATPLAHGLQPKNGHTRYWMIPLPKNAGYTSSFCHRSSQLRWQVLTLALVKHSLGGSWVCPSWNRRCWNVSGTSGYLLYNSFIGGPFVQRSYSLLLTESKSLLDHDYGLC
jgi:hypothetical protein